MSVNNDNAPAKINLGSELKKYEKFASWGKCKKYVVGDEIIFDYGSNHIKFVMSGTYVKSMDNFKGGYQEPMDDGPTEEEIIEYFYQHEDIDSESESDLDDFEEAESQGVDSITLSCGTKYLLSEIEHGSDLYFKVMKSIGQ